MSTANKSLGRGLDALFGGSEPQHEVKGDISLLPLTVLRPNPDQPRQHFDPEGLQELADSIKAQGIIQPLLVRPQKSDGTTYQIVAGERRWRAARLAGLAQVPVFVRELSDKEVMAAALIENLQREDLNPIEEALALQGLRDALELTQEELAARLGKSRPAIANALRLLQLSPAARDDLRDGNISAGHARCLLAVTDMDAAEALRQRIISHALTVRDAEEATSFWREKHLLPWQTESAATNGAPAREGPRVGRKKSPQIRSLQKNLSQVLACKALVSGNDQNGKITLSYASAEELQKLLTRLGVSLPKA
ncbi:ParB/RepB/Spo0J family partition protein [uncultured Desulfovibrio sp.]|uniref:ParB/RepB/Spo0J family partition protein n=1 Tax=uncultured Desulfovibrio sp. TaxID=167968 RepID=UPI0003A553BA|nr:ParB/RepB/Spo0J family partition protein [uncultured Desulfovibrio sp.]